MASVSAWSETLSINKKRVIEELVNGQECANQLQILFHDWSGKSESLSADELVHKIFTSFNHTLSMLTSQNQRPACKDKRGCCYKRRKADKTWTVVSATVEDEVMHGGNMDKNISSILNIQGVTLGAVASMIKVVRPLNKSKELTTMTPSPRCIRSLILELIPADQTQPMWSLMATPKFKAKNCMSLPSTNLTLQLQSKKPRKKRWRRVVLQTWILC